MPGLFTRFKVWVDDEGATAPEYAIMVALIAAVIIAIVGTLGERVVALFASVPAFG